MANNKSKKTSTKKTSSKPKAAATKSVKTVKAEAAAVKEVSAKSNNPLKGLFAKKCDPNESILTIFKTPKIWGAIVGELVGTMFLSILLLTLGVYQPLYVLFGVIAITMAVYAFSGAHLNPAITAGMMASRRVSAIRGILYIVAQVVGAWIGLLIVNGFRIAGEEAAELPAMTPLEAEALWKTVFVEFLGTGIIGYFFSRAQSYRTPRGAFTYAAVIGGGVTLALIIAIVLSSNFLGLTNNFMMNPAVSIMYQIFPSSADSFGALMGDIALEAFTYILIPVLGAGLGFLVADVTKKLSGEE